MPGEGAKLRVVPIWDTLYYVDEADAKAWRELRETADAVCVSKHKVGQAPTEKQAEATWPKEEEKPVAEAQEDTGGE